MVAAGDVSTADDVNGITVRTIGQFERLAHVFNKRISKVHVGRFVDRAEADFDELIAINLKGPWLKTHAALRAIIPSGRSGAIVNTSSFLSTAATLGTSAYSASKAGINSMDPRHRPGDRAARYPRQQHQYWYDKHAHAACSWRRHHPATLRPSAVGKHRHTEDIADVAVWPCTDEAQFLTGQPILVDGGFTIPGPR